MKTTITILLAIILLVSCSKEKPNEYDVTLTAYSKEVPYTLGYSSMDEDYSETINTQNYTKNIKCADYDFDKQMGVIKIGTVFPDSILIRVSFDGKSAESSTSINCPCSADVMVQLSQAK